MKDLRNYWIAILWGLLLLFTRAETQPKLKLVRSFSDHQTEIKSLSFNSDGAYLAYAGKDSTLTVLDLANSATLLSYKSQYAINYVAFYPDDTKLLSSCSNGLLLFWDTEHWNPIDSLLDASEQLGAISFSPDHKYFACAANSNINKTYSVLIINSLTNKREKKHYLDNFGLIYSINWNSNGHQITVGGHSNDIIVFPCSLSTKEKFHIDRIPTHSNWSNSVAFDRTGVYFATGGQGGVVRLWNANTYELVDSTNQYPGRVRQIIFTKDNNNLIAAYDTPEIIIYSYQDKKLKHYDTLKDHQKAVSTIALDPENRQFASASIDGVINLYEVTGIGEAVIPEKVDTIINGDNDNEQKPLVKITEPNFNLANTAYIYKSPVVSVKGNIESPNDIRYLRMNDQFATLNQKSFYIDLNLSYGSNFFIMQVEDVQGKKSEEFFIICREDREIDTTPPEIVIIEPKLDPFLTATILNKTRVTLRGRAIDKESRIKNVIIDDEEAFLFSNNEFEKEISLSKGQNTIIITATDDPLGAVPNQSPPKRIILTSIQEIDVDGPEITIIEPKMDESQTRGLKKYISDQPRLRVSGKLYDPSNISRVLLNNIEVRLDANNNFTGEVILSSGENEVIVEAYDKSPQNNRSLKRIYVNSNPVIKDGNYYALIIGINKYSGNWHPLKTAVNDARVLYAILEKNYIFNRIDTLMNEQATRSGILGAIDRMLNETGENDNILIYYAGHGDKDGEITYWVPANANSKYEYINSEEILVYLKKGFKSRHVFLIADACFSGGLLRGGEEHPVLEKENIIEIVKKYHNRCSRLVLASGGMEPVDDGTEHSPFARTLIRTLNKSEVKFIFSSSIYHEVKLITVDQKPEYGPVKDSGHDGGEFIFIGK